MRSRRLAGRVGAALTLALVLASCSRSTKPTPLVASSTTSPQVSASGFVVRIEPAGCPWAPQSVTLQDANTGETIAVGHQIGWTATGLVKFRFLEIPSVLFNVTATWTNTNGASNTWGPYDQVNAKAMPILQQNPSEGTYGGGCD